MSDLRIRHARNDELDAVAALIVDAYAEHAAAMPAEAWGIVAVDIARVHARRGDDELIVAERDGRLVGAVAIAALARPVSAAVRLLAVPPGERNTGIGSALMRWCAQYARTRGQQRLIVTMTPEMAAMRDLSTALGFTRAPELDHEPTPGVRIDAYALTLEDDHA